MREDEPRPSKRPFGFPLPVKAWEYLVNPNRAHTYDAPAMIGDELVFCNGWLGVRASRFELHSEMPLEADEVFQARFEKLDWGRFSTLPEESPHWQELDKAALTLWRNHPRPIWEKTVKRFYIRTEPLVRIGAAGVTSLALVQLVARLPRVEVWTRTEAYKPIFFRFNGGTGILASFDRKDAPVPALSILTPKRDPLEGRGIA